MAEKTPQAKADDKRNGNHFQVRLDSKTADQLRHFMASRKYNANEAIRIIISRFFK